MTRKHTLLLLLLVWSISLFAQQRKVENKPYIDLRPFHFGVLVGSHLQDIEFLNVGPQIITLEDGTTEQRIITCDQDRWDPGFNVGVLGEFRLNTNFQLRVAPAMYFGTRHFTLNNLSDERRAEEHQDLKTAYISTAFDLIFAGPRFNNRRPYLMAGVNPMLNLSGKDTDYIRLKRSDLFLEAGIGCDFYLPFFKLRPELKFLFGLGNSLDTTHPDRLRDPNMKVYAKSVKESHTKMIVLSFYFE